MFKIVRREEMSDGNVVSNEIEAPLIASIKQRASLYSCS